VSADTARRYLTYLGLSYQVVLLEPYYRNLTSSVIKTPKLYWLDVGILRQLSGFRGELSGEVYETMVVSEIHKWIKTMQDDVEMYFYRTRSGLEVDIILKTRSGLLGLEIKSHAATYSDTYGLRAIAGQLKDEWKGGIVVYSGDEIKRIAEPEIWAVPSKRLFT
jgi:predicted AAA+ superfamily ATPase